jgi:sulfur-carrier protein adenylyltransferase/sulfurtransferase
MKRYNRQMILSGFGEEKQLQLSAAKVLVIGAGGLGAPILLYLAGAGVGKIGIIDYDKVELSNLHRQVIFSENELGKSKAESAAEILKNQNSDIEIQAYDQFLDVSNAEELIQDYDIVIDGTDNFSTRYLVNDVCAILEKPLIYGAIFKFEGQISLFNVKDLNGISYDLRDLFPLKPNEDEVPNCSEAGVLGPLAGQIGTIMANVAIQLITGLGKELAGKVYLVNSLSYQSYLVKLSKDLEVKSKRPFTFDELKNFDYGQVCHSQQVRSILPEHVNTLMENNLDYVVLDVREPHELPRISGLNTINLPFSRITTDFNQLEKYPGIVVCCQTGKRSTKAASILQEEYPDKIIFQLEGGISSWLL